MKYNNEFSESIGSLSVGVYQAEDYNHWMKRGEALMRFAWSKGLRVAPAGAPLDKYPWPENQWLWTDRAMRSFNEIMDFLESGYDNYFEPMYFTPAGCIGKAGSLMSPCQIGLTVSTTRLNLLVFCPSGAFKLSIGGKCVKDEKVSFWGKQGLDKIDKFQKKITGKSTFRILKEHGRELSFDEGMRVKSEIVQPRKQIYIDDSYKRPDLLKIYKDINTSPVYEHCYHDDMNSSFCAGIIAEYPEITPGIQACYDKRMELKGKKDRGELKRNEWYENELCKFALSSLHGKFQEKKNPQFAQVAKAGIDYNNRSVDERIQELGEAGYLVLAINIDGIWYQDISGRGQFKNDKNGDKIGQWKCDHKDCKLRFKSAGAYEYIEGGKYFPVMSGTSSYENAVPRSKWSWGDIFKGNVNEYRFNYETARIEKIEEVD